MLFKVLLLQLCLTGLSLCQKTNHGFFRGYKNNRSWGTGSQGQAKTDVTAARMGRQQGDVNFLVSAIDTSCSCSAGEERASPVCGTDGQTYSSVCEIKSAACSMLKRQGGSFQSVQLKLEMSYQGPCRSPCEGMLELGHFQAFGSKATNSGMCVHDFFSCARTLRAQARDNTEVETCCQRRFDRCSQL